jgi:nucleoside-diphosphate-sugar epimerase
MILVTGATGFVGSHVLRRFDGRPARAMVRDRSRSRVSAAAEIVEADLTRPETLPPALAGVDTVIHAAAITANEKEPHPGAYYAINTRGTQNLAAAARPTRLEVATASSLPTRSGWSMAVLMTTVPPSENPQRSAR